MYTLAIDHFATRRGASLDRLHEHGAQSSVLRLPRDGVAAHQAGQKREQEARQHDQDDDRQVDAVSPQVLHDLLHGSPLVPPPVPACESAQPMR